jgi:hypothetical protein
MSKFRVNTLRLHTAPSGEVKNPGDVYDIEERYMRPGVKKKLFELADDGAEIAEVAEVAEVAPEPEEQAEFSEVDEDLDKE